MHSHTQLANTHCPPVPGPAVSDTGNHREAAGPCWQKKNNKKRRGAGESQGAVKEFINKPPWWPVVTAVRIGKMQSETGEEQGPGRKHTFHYLSPLRGGTFDLWARPLH